MSVAEFAAYRALLRSGACRARIVEAVQHRGVDALASVLSPENPARGWAVLLDAVQAGITACASTRRARRPGGLLPSDEEFIAFVRRCSALDSRVSAIVWGWAATYFALALSGEECASALAVSRFVRGEIAAEQMCIEAGNVEMEAADDDALCTRFRENRAACLRAIARGEDVTERVAELAVCLDDLDCCLVEMRAALATELARAKDDPENAFRLLSVAGFNAD